MGNGVDETALTWQDFDDQTHFWPSVDAWVGDWWAAEREASAAYQAERAGQTGVRWPDAPSHALLGYLERERDPRVVALIAALAEVAETEQDFSDLGAGDIEDLLCHSGMGGQFIDEVELVARRSPAFARTLTWMWVGSDIEPSLRARLLALGAIDLAAGQDAPRAQKKGRRPSKRQVKRPRHP